MFGSRLRIYRISITVLKGLYCNGGIGRQHGPFLVILLTPNGVAPLKHSAMPVLTGESEWRADGSAADLQQHMPDQSLSYIRRPCPRTISHSPVFAPTKVQSGMSTALHQLLFCCLTVVLAGAAGWLHSIYTSRLHDNHLSFSHLSALERELTFRTEMGFYYSYFKQVCFIQL
ncbi:unnamed protein product [Protopolystoma xenopodis]|uniref:Uncharacterized protein n=1 Tax=Protopolystoma xenopodis TaxID=117903 RepID=A0A3S5AJA1_9PLAT|nr:unnamed protein product [Protopolystoma xenopodis]